MFVSFFKVIRLEIDRPASSGDQGSYMKTVFFK